MEKKYRELVLEFNSIDTKSVNTVLLCARHEQQLDGESPLWAW